MSGVNEEYQEQVLEDLSDIKESVTTDSGYQEKVLDDLDDIKESVSEQQEFYDEEYQKKVLGNLRSLQKSVETLSLPDLSPIELDTYFSTTSKKFAVTNDVLSIGSNPYGSIYICSRYLISGHNHIYVKFDYLPNTIQYQEDFIFTSNDSLNSFVLPDTYNNVVKVTSTDYYDFYNSDNDTYLYFQWGGYTAYPDNYNYLHVYYAPDDEISGDVTSGSAVMLDGINTLIQISTFQSFASALLTGILLFLVFVKGLRR